jgi:GNAT superfamily N-acetyltransferase
MKKSITTYYLSMDTPDALRPSTPREPSFQAQRAEVPSPELGRFLYTAVGGDWYWLDRLSWTYPQWLSHLSRPEVETWVGYVQGTPAGYFELERQADHTVEIVYFGLLPQFIGRGVGGALLTAAIRQAWNGDTRRVWVHTCSLDGPNALQNYYARGFQLERQDTHEADLPDAPIGPWPGAHRITT